MPGQREVVGQWQGGWGAASMSQSAANGDKFEPGAAFASMKSKLGRDRIAVSRRRNGDGRDGTRGTAYRRLRSLAAQAR